MTPKEEAVYMRGSRAVYREMLGVVLRGLDVEQVPDSPDDMRLRIARLETVHADTVSALRSICEEFGDNEWRADAHLPDVIEDHLARNLRSDREEEPTGPHGPATAGDAERKVWARLLKAVEVRWREDFQGGAQVDYLREIEAAKQALRDLDVGIDALLAD